MAMLPWLDGRDDLKRFMIRFASRRLRPILHPVVQVLVLAVLTAWWISCLAAFAPAPDQGGIENKALLQRRATAYASPW